MKLIPFPSCKPLSVTDYKLQKTLPTIAIISIRRKYCAADSSHCCVKTQVREKAKLRTKYSLSFSLSLKEISAKIFFVYCSTWREISALQSCSGGEGGATPEEAGLESEQEGTARPTCQCHLQRLAALWGPSLLLLLLLLFYIFYVLLHLRKVEFRRFHVRDSVRFGVGQCRGQSRAMHRQHHWGKVVMLSCSSVKQV